MIFGKRHANPWTRGIAALFLALPAAAFASGSARVSLDEWSLSVQATDAAPGEVMFTVRNDGSYTHALELERDGREIAESGNLAPGESATMTVDLRSGRYEIYCPIDGHKAQGLDAWVQLDDGGLRVVGDSGGDSDSGGGYGGGYEY